ncbi:MAG: DUF4250 domain-containing protein [Butyrivibrio sp.]|nr:DUF4250 domain-containing protein [Butyrivibrio sp.]MBQ7430200.1 DUF4250 domain-containing protein [Butyrivibrio sp.]
MIPNDPVMLLSYINMQLRDNYNTLEALQEGLSLSDEEMKSIISKLEMISYIYNPTLNQFK